MNIKKMFFMCIFLIGILPGASLAADQGYIQIFIEPSGVRTDARWSYDGGSTWLESGYKTSKIDVGTYIITFNTVTGWISPSPLSLTVTKNKTSAGTGIYQQGGGGVTVPEDWTVWGQPSYQGENYAPLSFTLINRNILAWVESDRTPTSSVWGSTVKMVDFNVSENIRQIEFPSTQRYLYSTQSNTTMNTLDANSKTVMEDNRFIMPEEEENWLTLEDPSETIANQQFTNSTVGGWVGSWITFIKESTKAGLPLSDTGHASPVVTWPDNKWLESLPGYQTYSEGLVPAYETLGGAVIFLPTNDGVIHAFDVDADDDGYFQELWGAMPLSSFLFGVYQEMHKQTGGLVIHPRIPSLGGPILVHDVEDGQGGWLRLLAGSTGEGVGLAVKSASAWDSETGRNVSSSLGNPESVSGHAAGVFALDVTSLTYNQIKQKWSVTNIDLGGGDGFLDLVSSATGNIWTKTAYDEITGGALPSFAGYRTLMMSLARPVTGYTGSNTRTWHMVLLGVDTESKFRLYDINPLTGELYGTTQLSETVPTGTEVELPSKIGAVAPWGETTPRLDEIYFYLSNGSFYSWDLNAGTAPVSLLDVEFKLQGEYYNAEVVQDFDGTFLEVDGETHRFVAFVVRLQKAGQGQGGGIIYGAIVVDVTKLVADGSLPQTLEIGTHWGQTNVFVSESDSVQSMYLAEHMHGNEAFPVSAPFFYDGKLIIAATGYQSTGSERGEYGKVFIADPITGEVQTDTYRDTKLIGGALVDESGVLRVATEDGTILSVDLTDYGLDVPGSGTGGGTSGEVSTVYWKIVN